MSVFWQSPNLLMMIKQKMFHTLYIFISRGQSICSNLAPTKQLSPGGALERNPPDGGNVTFPTFESLLHSDTGKCYLSDK